MKRVSARRSAVAAEGWSFPLFSIRYRHIERTDQQQNRSSCLFSIPFTTSLFRSLLPKCPPTPPVSCVGVLDCFCCPPHRSHTTATATPSLQPGCAFAPLVVACFVHRPVRAPSCWRAYFGPFCCCAALAISGFVHRFPLVSHEFPSVIRSSESSGVCYFWRQPPKLPTPDDQRHTSCPAPVTYLVAVFPWHSAFVKLA